MTSHRAWVGHATCCANAHTGVAVSMEPVAVMETVALPHPRYAHAAYQVGRRPYKRNT